MPFLDWNDDEGGFNTEVINLEGCGIPPPPPPPPPPEPPARGAHSQLDAGVAPKGRVEPQKVKAPKRRRPPSAHLAETAIGPVTTIACLVLLRADLHTKDNPTKKPKTSPTATVSL